MNNTSKNKIWDAYKFPIILISAIVLGSLIGLGLGERATVLKPFGDIFLNLMFTIVVPLVFVTISSAVANMGNMKRLGKILRSLALVFVVTGLIASVIMIATVSIAHPGQGVNIQVEAVEEIQKLNAGEQIVKAITVKDFTELISRRNMLPLILFAIFFGVCIASLGEKGKGIAKGLESLSGVLMKMVQYIMYYAPIGLAAYFAALIGEFGPKLLGSYAKAMAVYYPVTILYFFIAFAAYSYFAGGKQGTTTFFKNIISPAVTALATQSSIATLPVNMESARKTGVPKDIRDIVMPIGATMHMDGTCLSSILKIAFLFGIYGKDFSGIDTFAVAILISVMGGVVMSGVPGGGLIGEMLIVNIYGFPPEAFPIIATIGFLVDPAATMVNATGDNVVSMMISRIVEGKDWMQKRLQSE